MPFNLPDPLVDDSSIQRNFDALTARVTDLAPLIQEVTSLPTAPVDKQTIDYVADATNGVVWRLRYRLASGSAYKWEFIGGSPLFAEVVTTNDETTLSGTYVALTTAGPSITLPLAGDYDIQQSAMVNVNGAGLSAYMSYDIGGTGAADADAAGFISDGVNTAVRIWRSRRKTGLTAVTLTAKYKEAGGATAHFYGTANMAGAGRTLQAMPVRVG